MKKLWAATALAALLVTTVSGCTIVDETPTTPLVSPETSTAPFDTDYPAAAGALSTNLVITLLEGNGLAASTRNLACEGGKAVAPTSIPDGDAACTLAEKSAAVFNTELQPTDDKLCRDTGNQVIADVFGESKGQHIRASFQRNNLCNAKVWDSLTPVIGLG